MKALRVWLVLPLLWSCGGGGELPPRGSDSSTQDQAPLPDAPRTDHVVEVVSPDYGAGDIEVVEDHGSATDQQTDLGVEEDSVLAPDSGTDVALECPGYNGCPCTTKQDCYSGNCVETMQGWVCASECLDESSCPDGWKCWVVGGIGADIVYGCVDPFARLCRPCKTKTDCVPAVGAAVGIEFACIEYGPDGRYCGVSCEKESDCPNGYSCDETAFERGTVRHCVSSEGECPCTPRYRKEGALTVCYHHNEFGTCYGERTCDSECSAKNPSPEMCNGEDDDCDGKTDEDVPSSACLLTNQYGTCQGKTRCTLGQEVCEGSYASPEACNAVDDDCDGETDEENAQGCVVYYKDGDRDGFGVTEDFHCLCAPVPGTYDAAVPGDCEDTIQAIHPGNPERCNDLDDDCDGQTDEDFLLKGQACDGPDEDACPEGIWVCNAQGSALECTDMTEGIVESCNGLDDDCDGQTDEEGSAGCSGWYRDLDGDGWGVTADLKCLCAATAPYLADVGGDCDDGDNLINPGATEVCANGRDDDCDSIQDEPGAAGCVEYFKDADGDGYGNVNKPAQCLCFPDPVTDYTAVKGGDCEDSIPSVHPNATEMCNGRDDDCDGQTDEDFLLKGQACDGPDEDACPEGIWVCNAQGSALECTDVTEANVESCNDLDDDCDGQTDEDFLLKGQACDGPDEDACPEGIWVCNAQGSALECTDVTEANVESCNDLDDDCDGQTDEDFLLKGQACDGPDEDACPEGIWVCNAQGSALECTDMTETNVESCNDLDDDCDGQTDEDFPSKGDACDGPDGDQCEEGIWICNVQGNGLTCNDATGTNVESCNNQDDDCDGFTDEDAPGCQVYYYDGDQDGYGTSLAQCLCQGSGQFTATQSGDCDDTNGEVHPGTTEKCNGIDDNCNGETDEDFPLKGQACDGPDADQCPEGAFVCNVQGTGLECSDVTGNSIEFCNNLDDDCDGLTDEDFSQKGQACDGPDADLCKEGTLVCNAQGNGLECSDTTGSNQETCNNQDDDCDGTTDEDASDCTNYYSDGDFDGWGIGSSKCLCQPSGIYTATQSGDCDDSNPSIHPGGSLCGTDGDCDGQLLDVGEECDDGNATSWDGCTGCLLSEFRVNTHYQSNQSNPRVAVLSAGGYVVVWHSMNQDAANTYGIYAQRFKNDGAKDGGEFLVNTFVNQHQMYPSVAPLLSGGFLVVWQSGDPNTNGPDGDGFGIFGQRFNANGIKEGSEFQVNTYTISHQQSPDVAVLSSGKFVVVWESNGQDGSGYGIYGQIFSIYGIKDGYEFRVNTFTNSHQMGPAIAPLSSGGFVAVWQSYTQDGSGYGIFGQRYQADGTPTGGEFQISSYTSGDQANAAVAALPSGGFVAVWSSNGQDGSGLGVYGQRYKADGTKDGGEFQLNSYTSNDQTSPSIAALPSGGFVSVWQSAGQDGAPGFGIFGQRYSADGTKVGVEFRLNMYSNSEQAMPSVAAFPSGAFVVVWHSDGQDGSNLGIFAQRYDANGKKIFP